MSLYSEYVKEREGLEIIESDQGFVTYQLFDKKCYIIDIYVVPEAREKDLASKMADQVEQIAREEYCETLMGSVCLNLSHASRSMKVLMGYGMKPVRVTQHDNMVYFEKQLGD